MIDHDNGEAGDYKFSAGPNLLTSADNSQGKSSLLKALYYTLGLDVKPWPKDWRPSKMTIKLDLHNETTHQDVYVVRKGDLFYVSDRKGSISVQEYTRWLSEQLGVDLKLTNKQTRITKSISHPSALIAPFYVDQDNSWSGRLFSSYGEMSMYTEIPLRIIEYILQISDDDELKLKEKISQLRKSMGLVSSKRSSMNEVYMDYLEDEPAGSTGQVSSILDPVESNRKDLEQFIQLMNKANETYIKHKATRIKLQREYDQRLKAYEEYTSIKRMLNGDYESIKSVCKNCKSELTPEQVQTRMDISTNLFELSFLISTTKLELDESRKRIEEAVQLEQESNNEYKKLADQVEANKGLRSIAEYIEEASKKKTHEEFASIIQKLDSTIGELDSDIKELSKERRELQKESTRRIDEVSHSYLEYVNDLSIMMKGSNVNDVEFKNFTIPQSSGVHSNQRYLGGYLTYMKLISQYGRYSLPFCIDSFIKNETAANKSDVMFNATEKYLLSMEKQTIFSAIDESVDAYMKNVDNYHQVRIEGRLLSPDKFKNALNEVRDIVTVD
jgi:hypothetical protein